MNEDFKKLSSGERIALVSNLYISDKTISQIAGQFGISKSTVHGLLRKSEDKQVKEKMTAMNPNNKKGNSLKLQAKERRVEADIRREQHKNFIIGVYLRTGASTRELKEKFEEMFGYSISHVTVAEYMKDAEETLDNVKFPPKNNVKIRTRALEAGLRYVHGQTIEDIAKELGTSTATISRDIKFRVGRIIPNFIEVNENPRTQILGPTEDGIAHSSKNNPTLAEKRGFKRRG